MRADAFGTCFLAVLAACGTDSDLFGEGATGNDAVAVSSTSGTGGGPGSGGGGPASSSAMASTSGSGGAAMKETGCSDGTREHFQNENQEPAIAGCSGGFQVAGVVTQESKLPQCGRMAGNDSSNPAGTGCSVEDLCAEGWHVCLGAEEVAIKSSSGTCGVSMMSSLNFWITRQPQNTQGSCAATGQNNITGCGTLGGLPASCYPLDRYMRWFDCDTTMTWFCGTASEQYAEAAVVTHDGPAEGGALCCID